MSDTTCQHCGCESDTDPCSRCQSETHWAGSDRAAREASPDVRAQLTAEIRGQIHDALTNLPDAYALLALFMLPGSAPVDPDGISGTRSPAKPPLRLEVIDLLDVREKPDAAPIRIAATDPSARDHADIDTDRRDYQWRDGRKKMTGSPAARRLGILPTLVQWVRLVDGELWDDGIEHGELTGAPTVASECSWLLVHLGWIIEQQWADEMAVDLTTMFDDVRRATGWTAEEPDRCPKCGWIVEARDGGAWYSCTGCPETWAMHAEISKLMARQEYVMTLRACAAEVGRPLSSLKEWRSRGWINPCAESNRGVSLFDVREVEEVHKRVVPGRPSVSHAV
jgi:hypothetical protein